MAKWLVCRLAIWLFNVEQTFLSAYLLGIVDIWRSCIGDLSENFRDYLYGIQKTPKEEEIIVNV